MKKNQLVFAQVILAAGLFAIASQVQAQVTIPKKLQRSIQPDRFPVENKIPVELLKIKNIDLAAQAINFSVVSAKNEFNASVKIEGVVSNVGTLNYISNANQQMALLYEQTPGGTPKLVASKVFRNLAVNATVKFSYTRNWNKADEFPPTYILIIGFDPDIYMDANKNNDDSNAANNKLSKSGTEINLLTFR